MVGWRCKSYGHRTGDRECPMFVSGNQTSERFRMVFRIRIFFMYRLLSSLKVFVMVDNLRVTTALLWKHHEC